MMPILLPAADASERSRLLAVDMIRRRALQRLYERRAAVDSLIHSLEDYQRMKNSHVAVPLNFSDARKCS
jgi:hypothetical protein